MWGIGTPPSLEKSPSVAHPENTKQRAQYGVQPCSNTAMQQYSHAAIQPCSNTAMQQYSHAAIQPCSNTPYSHACHASSAYLIHYLLMGN
jgi:hypothetical protein